MGAIFFGILAFFIWSAVFFTVKLRLSNRGHDALAKAFLQEENEANSARKRAIDASLFFIPDLSLLPIKEEGGIQQQRVLQCAEQKMIHFSKYVKNAELKKAYGPSQLEQIAYYEENFNEYLSALIKWAEKLWEAGQNKDALRILEYTVALGSEFRKSYTLTADLYAAAQEWDKLNALLRAVEAVPFKDLSIKRHVVTHIINKRSDL